MHTPSYVKRAQKAYYQRYIAKGMVRRLFWMKPEWKNTVQEFINKLEEEEKNKESKEPKP